MGKIISEIDFKFVINNKNIKAIIMFELKLNNDSKILVIGYNEMADFCYSKLKPNDKVTLQGYLNSEINVIIENIKKYI